MGGHHPTLLAANGSFSFPVTPRGTQGPPALSPYTSQSVGPGSNDSPQLPRLTPQRTASVSLWGPLDPEEVMESDSQAGSGSGTQ